MPVGAKPPWRLVNFWMETLKIAGGIILREMTGQKAQAGLEYLLSYGWALILIATIIGVVIFVVTSPNQDLIFRSSDPTKILLKGAAALGEIVQIKLQNITGGKIRITALTSSDYTNMTLNGQTLTTPIEIGPGGEITIEATGTTGTITINYTDQAGIPRTATITATGQGGTTTEPEGTPITACGTTISETGTYYLQDNLTTSSGNCITINADNVTINGNGKTITKTGGLSDTGIALNGNGNTVQNCSINGFYYGIYTSFGFPFPENNTVTGNTLSGNYMGTYITSGINLTVTANTANNNQTGIFIYAVQDSTVQGNTANNNSDTGLDLVNFVNSTIQGNTANSNVGTGIALTEILFGTTVTGNTARYNNSTGAIGIHVSSSSDCTLSSNNASDNYTGIYVAASTITMQGNTASDNSDIGVKVTDSWGDILNGNAACNNAAGDFSCTNSQGASGTGNEFGVIGTLCINPIWPQLGVHYSPCP